MTTRPAFTSPRRGSVLIIGCGDIGQRVASLEQSEGRNVMALVRSRTTASGLAHKGISLIDGDLDQPLPPGSLPRADTLYYFAPPPATGTDDPRLRHALASLDQSPGQIVYISTSGVYGDCDGAWVDENWPLQPKTGRGQRRMAAERMLHAWSGQTGTPVVILRVPGIYGPGRLPVERIRQGTPVILPEEAPYTNRIHADDLAAACLAAARKGQSGAAYNVSDGHPTTMTDYFWRIADLYGLPRPPAIPLAEARQILSPAMLSFLDESKRLDNRRMLHELGVSLRYPDLSSGLPACL